MKSVVFLCLSIIFFQLAFGQPNCETNLDDARINYINGDFGEVIKLLSGCTGKMQRSQDNLDAYELLINSYLIINQQATANELTHELLAAHPLYEPKPTALIPYKTLINSYKIRRRFGLRLMTGINQPNFQVMQHRSYGGIVEETNGYVSRSGYTGGLLMDLYLLETLAITTGLSIQNAAYAQSEKIMGFQRLDVEENLTYLKIPLLICPSVKLSHWEVILGAGLNVHLLSSSRTDLELYGLAQGFPNPLTGISRKVQGYRLDFQRQKNTLNYQANISLARNIGLFRVEATASYEHGLRNLTKTEKRYSNNELLTTYSYVPDDFKMNSVQFRLGITRFFVFPKKINR